MIDVTKPSLPDLQDYVRYLERIWQTRWITNHGQYEQLLENKLKDYLQLKELVLVSNGTLALQLALRSFNLRGEVITTPFTFIATTNAIVWEGLTPVFADIDPETFNIDPEDVRKKISKKTSAILGVHVFGNPCDVKELQSIASENDLSLIFDGAHSFGVEYANQSVLNFGDISTLSFHATKVFNTIEGGALVTRDTELARKLRLMLDNGIRSEDEIACVGINAKMNEFEAAMGLCNLESVERDIACRGKLFRRYQAKLRHLGHISFQRSSASKQNYSYMPILLKDVETRDRTHNELKKHGIMSRKYFYPLTVCSGHFKHRNMRVIRKNLRQSFDVADRILCLPLFPEIDPEEVDRIVKVIVQVL